MKKILFSLLCVGVLLTGCGKPDMTVTDTWVGRWVGPEGTSLMISKDTVKPRYILSIQSLDYLKTYLARPVNNHLKFKRDKKVELVVFGKGTETGMKWLQDKQECLIIQPGEAFCRK